MPQDSLRSVVYRSFVTCDDPKGVAECKTIRESMTHSNKIQQNSNTDQVRNDKVQKESTEELQKLSSFQIMKVSKGAQKLNQVIDSLSNRTSFDKQYIAKDLLKGALDLQDSLTMLGKLQQASHYITNSKKIQKIKPEFEKPKISLDGSFRDCYDELREVIRESFARQNLLPKVSSAREKKHYVDRKDLDLYIDFPSSSSSQSKEKDYVDCCTDFQSSSSNQSSLINSSHSCDCPPSKGPNLIAKLMGLHQVPQKGVDSIDYKQMEKEKLSNQRSHLLDIDLPRPSKPRFVVQKVVRERRKLEEMIETMQFKGLVERKSSDGKCKSDVSFLRKSLAVDGPPIVIMRPLRVPQLRAKELHEDYWIKEEKSYLNKEKPIKIRRQMPRKMREEFPLNALQFPKGQLKFTEKNEKLRARKTSKQKLNKDKEVKHSGESPVKKTLNIQDKLSSTMKVNLSKPLVPRVQKKEEIVKNIDNISKVASNTRKQARIKDAESKDSAKTQDQGRITTLKLRDSNVSKCPIARGKTTATPQKHMKPTSFSSIPKKNLQKAKPDSKPLAALVENIQTDGSLPINVESNIQESLMKSITSEQITEEGMNSSYISTSDNSGNAASSPRESSGPIIKDDMKYIEDDTCVPGCNLDEMKGCESVNNTRYLLSSSLSFLSRAEELFDIKACDTKVLPTDSEMLDDSLLLECATDILERKSLRCTWTVNPLPHNLLKKPKCRLSVEQLIREICDGIEVLRNYSKSCRGIILVDSICSMLERDLLLNEEVTGAWDLGWRSGNTIQEVNGVVHDVEKLVLSEIITDLIIEFMF